MKTNVSTNADKFFHAFRLSEYIFSRLFYITQSRRARSGCTWLYSRREGRGAFCTLRRGWRTVFYSKPDGLCVLCREHPLGGLGGFQSLRLSLT